MKTKMLQQDVTTRWNSTFDMMKSLLDQKRALHGVYGADHELPACFCAYQWGLVENMTTLLNPFEQLTKDISSHLATTADVIPSVLAMKPEQGSRHRLWGPHSKEHSTGVVGDYLPYPSNYSTI